MYAYDEIYLNDAMRNLGEAFDYSAKIFDTVIERKQLLITF